ncbi:MAG: hypothetical protein IV100_14015 [Myxococcales bacterium]|nr:hypothetical protein [Myxococcales bacterium]
MNCIGRLCIFPLTLWATGCTDSPATLADTASTSDVHGVELPEVGASDGSDGGSADLLEIGPPGPDISLFDCDAEGKKEGIGGSAWCERELRVTAYCHEGTCYESDLYGSPSGPPKNPADPGQRAPYTPR